MDFEEVWGRIKESTELKRLNQLSEIVSKSHQNISARKKKGDFPIEWAYLVGKQYNLSLEWILTGKGSVRESEKKKPENHYILLVDEWLSRLKKEDDRREIWFKCNFEDAFPKFADWLSAKEAEEKKGEFLGGKVRERVD